MDNKLALETIKSFQEIMTPEDFEEFLKSEDSAKLRAFPEVQEFLKAEGNEGESEKNKKTPKPPKPPEPPDLEGEEKEEGEDDEEGSQGGKTKNLEEEEEEEKNKKKSASNEFSTLTNLIQKAIDLKEDMDELKKSVDDIKGVIEKIAGMPLGTKAIKTGAAAQYLEKAMAGDFQDEAGKRVVSVSRNKDVVLKALETGFSKATDDDLKKAYEGSIVRYNAGGGTIDQEVAIDLFEKHNIRLVR